MATENKFKYKSDEYNDGYEDGKADVDNQAFFMGVGYGKKLHGVKHIGFNTKKT